MTIQEKLLSYCQKAIALSYEEVPPASIGATRFGGAPDVPADFEWPYFETSTYEDEVVKPRPLSFLAQFCCEDLAPYDAENLLPKHGLLSFFYEFGSQRWGYDPTDKGCARVFWFEDTKALIRADVPAELEEDFRFAPKGYCLQTKPSYPSGEDFAMLGGEADDDFYGVYDALDQANSSKILGWATLQQGNMTMECALVTQGYYLGGPDGWAEIPKTVKEEAKTRSIFDWQLLLQLDSEGELMFGDCGMIYFYIKKEDLAARRFDRAWLVLQCG